jgi:hypothetical protein
MQDIMLSFVQYILSVPGLDDGVYVLCVWIGNGRSVSTGTCFIQKVYAPSSSLLQGKHLPFSPSPLRLNILSFICDPFADPIISYTPEIFLFSTATFKYTYRPPSYELDKNSQRTWPSEHLIHWNGYSHFRFALDFSYAFGIL